MEISLKKLCEGKGTIIKNREYFPTKQYVGPFIKMLSSLTNDFRAIVKMPKQMTISDNLDETYNRVLIMAILPKSYDRDDLRQVIGMIYGLDVKKPIVKFFRAGLDPEDNLILFDKNCLKIEELEPETAINYAPVKTLLEQTDALSSGYKKLQNTSIPKCNKNTFLGDVLERTIYYNFDNEITQKVKLSTADIIAAYKLVYTDSDSSLYIGEQDEIPYLNFYTALARQITKSLEKDLMNTVEKTLLIKSILHL